MITPYQKRGENFFRVYVCARDDKGNRLQLRRSNVRTMKEAKDMEFKLKRELIDMIENPILKWGDWHKQCVDRMKFEMRPSTIFNYDLSLKKWTYPIWKERDIKSITPNDVYNLIFGDMAEQRATSKKHVLKMTKRLFNMAIEDGLMERNPAQRIKVKLPETKQAVLNAGEANLLLSHAKAVNHKFYEIWAVALLTGMRSGELYALKWTDIDFVNKRISVNKSWCSKAGIGPTKSSKNRVVPISGELERLLKEMKLKSSPDYEFVLSHPEEWTHGDQAKVLKEFCISLRITPVKFHDLRATFITQLLLKGVSLAQVMAMVGHADLKTTNVYLRIIGSDLDGATEKLSIVLPHDKLAEVIDVDFRSGKN